jgi:rod shape-determining protein MreC
VRRSQTRTTIYFLVALILSVVVINLNHTAGMQRAKGIAQAIVLPAAAAMNAVTSGVGHVFSTLGEIGQVQQQNRALREEIDRLQAENAQLQVAKNENVTLKEALNFQEQTHYRGVMATIIAREPEGLAHTVVLDVGERKGVRLDMVVVTGRGLVGRVVEIGPFTSRVLLALDTNSRVNAQLPQSKAFGTVEGTGVGMHIKITTPPAGLTVAESEPILTSGLGGHYPPKIVIGYVANFQRRDYAIEQLADVQPAVDFGRLQQVMVLVDFKPAP